eukprot:7195329-Pyramimonas_sp.AAC.1
MWHLDVGYLAWCDSEALDDLHERAGGYAKKLEAQSASSRAKQWRGFVQGAVQAGAGRAQQSTKPPVGWRP